MTDDTQTNRPTIDPWQLLNDSRRDVGNLTYALMLLAESTSAAAIDRAVRQAGRLAERPGDVDDQDDNWTTIALLLTSQRERTAKYRTDDD